MTSFHALPPEILQSIAMNLGLQDYLRFRTICRKTWRVFGCQTLKSLLEDIRILDGDKLNDYLKQSQLDRCHYISRGHVLLFAYRKKGLTPALKVIVSHGASLRHVPCGDIVEGAAQENDYESRLNWLMQHGASYREVPGGINKLFRDAFLRHDSSQKLIWMIKNGACPHALADIPMHFLSQLTLSPLQGPRSEESARWRLRLLRSSKPPLGVRWRRRLLPPSETSPERPLKRQNF